MFRKRAAAALGIAISAALWPPSLAAASGAPAGWQVLADNLTGAFVGVDCPDTADCWAVGDTSGSLHSAYNGVGFVAFSRNFGESWSTQFQAPSITLLSGISCPTDQFCVTVGYTDGDDSGDFSDYPYGTYASPAIFMTTDAGSSWTQPSVPFQQSDHPTAVSCADTEHCQVAGYDMVNGFAVPVVFGSSDEGATWSRTVLGPTGSNIQPSPAGYGDGISCPDAQHCWMTVDDGRIYSTSDGGSNWALSDSAPDGSSNLDSIDCPSDLDCLVGGPYGQVTTDGGQTWQGSGADVGTPAAVSCPTSTDCREVSPPNSTNGRTATTTDDLGGQWSYDIVPVVSAPEAIDMYGVSCPTASQCLAVGRQFPSSAGDQPLTETWTTSAGGVMGGYWLAEADGGVYSYGQAGFFGSLAGQHLPSPIVAIAPDPAAHGYWLVAANGGVYEFGSSTGGADKYIPPPRGISGRVVDAIIVPGTESGYFVTDTGAVYSVNDAPYYGGANTKKLNAPIVGMALSPTGYWLVAADGGVFTYAGRSNPRGNGRTSYYFGSMGGQHLAEPVVGMAATPDEEGYWLVARDGGIFSFGDATFYGSTGNLHLNAPIIGMTAPDSGGYWLVASDGGVFSFGDAGFYGSAGENRLAAPIVGVG